MDTVMILLNELFLSGWFLLLVSRPLHVGELLLHWICQVNLMIWIYIWIWIWIWICQVNVDDVGDDDDDNGDIDDDDDDDDYIAGVARAAKFTLFSSSNSNLISR